MSTETPDSKPPIFAIRKCKAKDILSVMNINETTLPENYPRFFYDQILDRFPESFNLAYLKDDPDTIIGYVMWRVERGPSAFGLNYVRKGHLVSLAVMPSSRRMGVAFALLENSMKSIAEYGVDEFVLEVRVSNIGAVRLYEEMLQFERIKIIGHYYRDGEDAFYMCLYEKSPPGYVKGSTGLTDNEIIQHYREKDLGYLCYRCPSCNGLLLKILTNSLPGSISPDNPTEKNCAFCSHSMKIFDISQGLYDVKLE